MKVQHLSIIYIIVIIPVILITAFYIRTQIEMLKIQTNYNIRLVTATKEAMDAFEINTVEWNSTFARVADSKRRDVLASVNAFVTGLANGLGIGGTSREFLIKHIPAIAFTLYDGYYIFGNTSVERIQTDSKGVALKYGEKYTMDQISSHNIEGHTYSPVPMEADKYEYNIPAGTRYNKGDPIPFFESDGITAVKEREKHILRPFIPYSARYKTPGIDITINYTLDNYIKIYGEIGAEYVRKSGYLVYFGGSIIGVGSSTNSINTTQYNEPIIGTIHGISNIIYNDGVDSIHIEPEILSEKIAYKENNSSPQYTIDVYKYVYSDQNTKIYYDDKPGANPNDRFFQIDPRGIKCPLGEAYHTSDFAGYTYKKVLIPVNEGGKWTYLEVYQALNGDRKGNWYFVEKKSGSKNTRLDTVINPALLGLTQGYDNDEIYMDYSAINYYVDAYVFTEWAKTTLGGIRSNDKVNDEGGNDPRFSAKQERIFNISASNNPEEKGSDFEMHKSEVIKQKIEQNLRQTIINYGKANPDVFDFKMPMLTEIEWEQVESNVSIIVFLQGLPLGRRYYNNYAIATSTKNKEYIDPNEIYFIIKPESYNIATGTGGIKEREYYHKRYCQALENLGIPSSDMIGYKSVDFLVRREENNTDDLHIRYQYYFLHTNYTMSNPDNTTSELACYYCLVDPSNRGATTHDTYNKPYYEALGRERYIQNDPRFLKWEI